MIQLRTILTVADNSGARKLQCFKVMGGHHRKTASLGDIIVCSVRDAIPHGALKKGGKLWMRVFPDKAITKHPAETRMGKGKGAPEYWAAVVKPGRVLFEIQGIPEDQAREAFLRASHKLCVKTKFIIREEI